MPFELLNLSTDQMVMIMEKMSRKSLCKIRRAHKTVDQIAEENRFYLAKRLYSDNSLSLGCKLTKKNKHSWYLQEPEKLWAKIWKSGFPLLQFLKDYNGIKENIENPYTQLSTQRFEVFKLDCRTYDYSGINQFLQKMRISCKLYVIASQRKFHKSVKQLIPLVKFSCFGIHMPIPLEEINSLPIQHCSSAHLYELTNVDQRWSSVFRRWVIPEVFMHTQEDESLSTRLKEFLNDIRRDSSSKGGLKKLHIIRGISKRDVHPDPSFIKTKRMQLVCYLRLMSYPYQCENKYFYQLKMKGGSRAVIILYDIFVEIVFVADGSRESLFDVIAPRIFTRIPFDVSATFDEYLAAGTFQTAIRKLLRGFSAHNNLLVL